MNKIIIGLACLLCSFVSRSNMLPGSALQPNGRYLRTPAGAIELIGSAANFGFRFSGTSCQLYTAINDPSGHNYLQYEMDGVYQKKIRIEGNSRQSVIISTAAAGLHTVRVYKCTEATTGAIFIEKIGGEGLVALPASKAPVIEFIGNSITCGALSDPSETPCTMGAYHDKHNAYYAYGPRVARALKLNYMLSSVSGIGMYRNWNSDGPTMPQVYEKAELQENGQPWDFSTNHPRIVSIALGTNDFSNGDGHRPRLPFDSAAFTGAYLKFVRLVKSKYPEARIALLSSPMVDGKNRILLQNCLTAVKKTIDAAYPNAKPVALYFFQPMKPRGCSFHPSIEDHAVMAAELTPFFKKLL